MVMWNISRGVLSESTSKLFNFLLRTSAEETNKEPMLFSSKLDPVPRVNLCPGGFCCCVKLDGLSSLKDC